MKFPWRIIGHEKVIEKLEQEFAEGRLAHAYLFTGPQEIGKFRLVKTFATLLQCEQGNLCRNCDACLSVEKNIHPSTTTVDRLWIEDKAEDLTALARYSNFDQSHRKKSGKRSDQIGVEDVAEFTRGLWQSTPANFKLCLVRDMERMTEEALNTFLKILEEPPEKTIFLLTVTHRETLLSTITSRTRNMEMGLVPNSILREALKELTEEKLSATEEEKILTLAQGRPKRLLAFLEHPEFLQEQDQLFSDLALLLKNKDIPALMAKAEELAKGSERALQEFLDGFLHFLRTLLREKTSGKVLSLGAALPLEHISMLIGKTEQTKERISNNVNKRLALEALLLAFS